LHFYPKSAGRQRVDYGKGDGEGEIVGTF
jgi:hypothetical protein